MAIQPLARAALAALLLCTSGSALHAQPQATERKPGDYPLGPDSQVNPAIAHGQLLGPFEFRSKVIPGTVRRYWVYVPAGYKAEGGQAPNLLVFQDGQRATNPGGSLRIQNVLDNLIAKGDIPQTVGVFVTPGNLSEHYPDNLGMSNPDHRWQEYDVLTDDFSRMLIDELLPEVARQWRFTSDPARRVIGGTSSGAIASFTVAWRHPEAFRNVISMIGSFTGIAAQDAAQAAAPVPAGDLYPRLIRKSPIRPIRIFLQDGSNDLDNEHGNWFLANQQMLAALNWANSNADAKKDSGPRYDVNHVWGDGAHSDQHGGSLLPDILRWIWRDQKPR
ncbi:MAG: esterase family protein [Sphingobium sp.]|nr:esterase family protein [Sphingobium sp.]